MPIPELDETGLLPPGLHVCSVEEIVDRFGQPRVGSPRAELSTRLMAYVEEARGTALIAWVGVDGSYVTSGPAPNGIDLLVVLRQGHDLGAQVRPFEYNLISGRRVRARYAFDVLVAVEGSAALSQHLTFFQTTRSGQPKGLLKVVP